MALFEDEETYWRSVETLPTSKLGHVSASEWAALSKADAYIFLPGPADLPRYRKNLPKSSAATGYNSDWYRRAEKAKLRGARLALGYATWSAEENDAVMRPSWDKATGGKDRLAALGIGLNAAVKTGFLQDDLAAGVVEIAIGDNSEFGGRNNTNFYLGSKLDKATVR